MDGIRPLAGVLLLVAAGSACAQVYKCVDAQGGTTYQQEACTRGGKGSRVDLQPDNGSTRDPASLEQQWVAAAHKGQVLPGMPKRYVQDAYGVPTEIRGGSTADRVSEIWVYRNPGGVRRVGFLDNRVAFDRGDDASSSPSVPDESGDTAARRAEGPSSVRRQIAGGQDCGRVIAEAGMPDRSEGMQVTSTGPTGQVLRLPAMRHVYDDDGGSPPRSVAFVCLNGAITEVERGVR